MGLNESQMENNENLADSDLINEMMNKGIETFLKKQLKAIDIKLINEIKEIIIKDIKLIPFNDIQLQILDIFRNNFLYSKSLFENIKLNILILGKDRKNIINLIRTVLNLDNEMKEINSSTSIVNLNEPFPYENTSFYPYIRILKSNYFVNGKLKDTLIKDIVDYIKKKNKIDYKIDNTSKCISCIWYCLNDEKFSNEEKKLFQNLAEYFYKNNSIIPIFFIHNQLSNKYDTSAVEKEIKEKLNIDDGFIDYFNLNKDDKNLKNNIEELLIQSENKSIYFLELFFINLLKKIIQDSLEKEHTMNSKMLSTNIEIDNDSSKYRKNEELATYLQKLFMDIVKCYQGKRRILKSFTEMNKEAVKSCARKVLFWKNKTLPLFYNEVKEKIKVYVSENNMLNDQARNDQQMINNMIIESNFDPINVKALKLIFDYFKEIFCKEFDKLINKSYDEAIVVLEPYLLENIKDKINYMLHHKNI